MLHEGAQQKSTDIELLICNLLRSRDLCQREAEFRLLSFQELPSFCVMRYVLSLPLFSDILRPINVQNAAKPSEKCLDGIRLQALAPSHFPSSATKRAASLSLTSIACLLAHRLKFMLFLMGKSLSVFHMYGRSSLECAMVDDLRN